MKRINILKLKISQKLSESMRDKKSNKKKLT